MLAGSVSLISFAFSIYCFHEDTFELPYFSAQPHQQRDRCSGSRSSSRTSTPISLSLLPAITVYKTQIHKYDYAPQLSTSAFAPTCPHSRHDIMWATRTAKEGDEGMGGGSGRGRQKVYLLTCTRSAESLLVTLGSASFWHKITR